jgi:protein-L-isoaspartate(D-aspartate) O-methyltransferase
MSSEAELAELRRDYAKRITAIAGVENHALEEAFAAIRREDYLGPGPWLIFTWTGYRQTPDSDPRHVYTDVLVGLIPERGLNNGEPSSHALWLASADPKPGDHAVHIGAGAGYYSAILAHMVGPSGRVTAIELDPALSTRATANLAPFQNVQVLRGNGATLPFAPADVIYVNAGVTHPADTWLDNLKEGGRLILPLTIEPTRGVPQGAMFRIERHRDEFLAHWISSVAIFPCAGMRAPVAEAALTAGFQKGGWKAVTHLYRTNDIPKNRCWVRAPGWCLASESK